MMAEFKSKVKNKKLHSQTREVISNVAQFMSNEGSEFSCSGGSETKHTFILPLAKSEERAAAACGVPRRTVHNIKKEFREMMENEGTCSFSTPKKYKRDNPVTGIDDFDRCVVRRTVHEFYSREKEAPTVEKVRLKLQERIGYNGSERSLRDILKSIGFRWGRTPDNRSVVAERNEIREKRIAYLQAISLYRQQNRPIVYMDESYILSTHVAKRTWCDDSNEGLHAPISKGQRAIIIHAGGEMGFIPNALVIWKAGTVSGDNHDQMNSSNYFKWVKEKLIPNLPPNSVLVIDNAPYHSIEINKAPSSNAKKADIMRWLQESRIPFSTDMLKPQLIKLVHLHKARLRRYKIDEELNNYGHSVLRLPPYHPDLNAIEMIWAEVKGDVAKKNVTFRMAEVMKLCEKKFQKWMPITGSHIVKR